MSEALLEIRPATMADRDPLAALLDRSFPTRAFSGSFADRFPHFFNSERIAEHWLAIHDGSPVGCLGCYRFTVRLHGRPLRAAGIGQVATSAEQRGGGVMSQLFAAALGTAEACDLYWLHGDRRRYGRFGFAGGGLVVHGSANARYAPPPTDDAGIRTLDPRQDADAFRQVLERRPFSLEMTATERTTMLAAAGITGLSDGEAAIISSHGWRTVLAVDGPPAAVARLIGSQVARRQAVEPNGTVTVHADPGDPTALQALGACVSGVGQGSTAQLRVGRLRPLLSAWAASHPPPPGARLQPTVLDGGPAGCVRVAAAEGAWTVTEADPALADLRYASVALAELVFGFLPSAAWRLPRDSVLNHLLPLHFTIPGTYAL